MHEVRDDRGWNVYAAAWELMALSFRYPEATLAEAVASGAWAAAAAEIAEALELADFVWSAADKAPSSDADERATSPSACADAAGARVEGGASPASTVVLRALRVEATRLFVGAPDPAASPYEGVWRAVDDGVQALLFVNPHSMDVERFMRSCGLGQPEGKNEPLDHVATECELLEYLALRAAGAEPFAGAPGDEHLPGGSPKAAYEAFLADHARIWMPRFAERTAAESREPFYCEAAHLLKALVG